MASTVACELSQKKCVPCEGGVQPLPPVEVARLLAALPGWKLTSHGLGIQRSWKCKDFLAALDFINKVGAVAEAEDHHPDIHLTGYRQLMIEMTTHAINGLSENDFILAAKIDDVPVAVKS